MKQNLFVSYSRVDSEFALRLVRDLRHLGIEVWFDQIDIPPGANWDDEIQMALDKAKIMIVILSEASGQSQNVKNEISHALELGKQVVPVLLSKGSVPLRITRLQREDFSGDYRIALAKLTRRLQGEGKTSSLEAITTEEVQNQAREAVARLSAESLPDIHAEHEPRMRVSEPGALGALTATTPPSSRSPWKSQRTLFFGLGLAAVAAGGAVMLRASADAGDKHAVAPTLTPSVHAAMIAPPANVATPPSANVATPPSANAVTISPTATHAETASSANTPAALSATAATSASPATSAEKTTALPGCPGASGRGAILFADPQYGGDCEQLTKSDDLGKSKVRNDALSSLQLGTCSAVTICPDPKLLGKCNTFSKEQPSLSYLVGADNSASSIECLVGSNGKAHLCSRPNIGGGCEDVGTTLRLSSSPMGNNPVVSFQLGTCRALKLCSESDLGGVCQTFTLNRSDFTGTKLANKRIASIECLDRAAP